MSDCGATAVTPTPKNAEPPARRVAVAASGGRDSTALLHATVRAANAECGLGIEVHALHVHHGLSPQADAWLAQVQRQCRRWGVAFHSHRLSGRPEAGQSVEAWARRERYRALHEMANAAGCSLLLLAQHRRDQAETWILQALRGGGPAGLAAMPKQASRNGIVWARPWLDQPREAIDAYVRRHRLSHVEDDSNSDVRFARNRLRLQVWPALVDAFADAEVALGAAARQSAQASALAAECAARDLPGLVRDGHLQVTAWLDLPSARRRNALVHWLAECIPAGVPGSLVERLLAELPTASVARWPTSSGELYLYRGSLGPASANAPMEAPLEAAPQFVDLSRGAETLLPAWHGHFRIDAVRQGGVPLALLRLLEARPRSGGERFKLAPLSAARSLKLQFQTRGVPAWQRNGPLLYTPDGRLLFVPGLGVDADLWARPSDPQRSLRWVPDAVDRDGEPVAHHDARRR